MPELPLPDARWADLPLAFALLLLALWLVLTRGDRAAVIGFTGYGLLAAVAWVRLGSVDVALTEATLGGGVTGVLLLTAVARLGEGADPPRVAHAWRALVALLCLAVAVGLALVVLGLPTPAPNLVAAVEARQAATELGNPVAAVLIAFRAVDTLLESVVLALAVIALWSFGADRAWGSRPRALLFGDPSPALVLLGRLLPPVGLIIGTHLFWTGADHPGGPFQGGAVLAAMAVLVWLARLGEPPPVGSWPTRLGLVFGPLLFLLIGLAGVVVADAFLGYPEALAKPLILLIELVVAFAATALAVALLIRIAAAEREEAAQVADADPAGSGSTSDGGPGEAADRVPRP